MDKNDVFLRVQALVHNIYWCADNGTVEDELALADPDIVIDAPAGQASGLAAYRQVLEKRRSGRGVSIHSVSNLRILSVDGDTVTFSFLLTNFLRDRPGAGPGDRVALALSEDAARWHGDTLKIVRRCVRPLMIWGEQAGPVHHD